MRPILFFLLFSNLLPAQPHPAWRHYTLNDGLPDNTVYDMCEDSIGRLIFATNAGICRFDGYRFQRFPEPDEINSMSAFFPKTDGRGRVWFRTMGGLLYILENDSIHAWKWNPLLEKYKDFLTTSTNFSIFENHDVQLQLNGFGFIKVDESGKIEEWTTSSGCMVWTETPGNSNQLRGTPHSKASESKKYKDRNVEAPHIIRDQFFNLDTVFNIPFVESSSRLIGLKLGKRHFLFLSQARITEIENDLPKRTFFYPEKTKKNPVKLEKMPDGRFFMSCIESDFGLYIFKDVEALMTNRPDTALLPDIEATAVFFDRSGGWWVTSHQNGVYYLPNPNIAIFDKEAGLKNEIIKNILADADQNVYFSDGQHQIFKLAAKNSQFQLLPDRPDKSTIKYLFYHQESKSVISGGDPVQIFQNEKWKIFPQFYKYNLAPNALISTKNGAFFYGLGMKSINKINAKDFLHIYRSDVDRNLADRFSTITETSDGRIWATKTDGLFEWRGDSVLLAVASRPEPLTRRVRQMLWTSDGVLVAATATGGVCFWKPHPPTPSPNGDGKAWFRQITERDGLTSDLVRCLAVQGDSVVWTGGNAGLNKITGWQPSQKLRVEQITVAHGLPSNQINGLCIADGFLWIASSGGLVRLGAMPSKLPPQRPILAEIFVKNKKWTGEKNVFSEFLATENDLEFRFFALNFRQNGKILYRFRLNENADWQNSMATSALFSSLAPGKYWFEVQAQNEDEIWGESTIFSFEIKPPWWADWPFRSAVILLLTTAVFAFYKNRTRQLKAKFALQKQLSELEQTALRAQMNPHFISNCLNSIQRCVLENNNEAAVRYLARFAKLTRTALEFSGRPQISLAEELTYLENYLELEKLRFKEKFDYKIEIFEGLDKQKTMLPPMLVQPLVENSIKHGFAKTASGGQIEINFFKNEKGLEVQCLDNGQGLADDFSNSKNQELSHALHLIRRRLDLLGQTGQQHFFEIKNRTDGQVGTLAVLSIPH